jgi:hypothetical protein
LPRLPPPWKITMSPHIALTVIFIFRAAHFISITSIAQ